MKKKTVTLIASILLITANLLAQDSLSNTYPSYKLSGALKNKYEYAPGTGNSRFSVRNSRIGVNGNINSYSSYQVQIELNSEGKFMVLDLSGTLSPIEGLSFTLGQTTVPLFNSYVVTPTEMLFANRAFLGKYFLGTRDLGLRAQYKFDMGALPTQVEFGVYNGNEINAPVWKKNISYGGRIGLGDIKQGPRASVKAYNYPLNETTHFLLYGADLRYKAKNWEIDTEILKRESKTDNNADLLSYYVQGAYEIPLRTKMFKFMKPALRWDAIDLQDNDGSFDVNRLTTGLGFGFKSKQYSSILRFDYEWYFVKNELDIFKKNNEMDSNKFTVELLFMF